MTMIATRRLSGKAALVTGALRSSGGVIAGRLGADGAAGTPI
jgi:hypothetical protein